LFVIIGAHVGGIVRAFPHFFLGARHDEFFAIDKVCGFIVIVPPHGGGRKRNLGTPIMYGGVKNACGFLSDIYEEIFYFAEEIKPLCPPGGHIHTREDNCQK
jgi:hypothetical protein